MSAFGGGTSFQIFNDDSENQTAVMRKAKREDASGKPPATKRAALGVLSNNTRVQPLRAVKQGQPTSVFGGINNENLQAKAAKPNFQFAATTQPFASQNFQIHVDNEIERKASSQCRTAATSDRLNSSITNLRPLTSLGAESIVDNDSSLISTSEDSPMLLDLSESKPEETAKSLFQKIIKVPEYSADIYEHLRTAELRFQPSPYMKKQPDINSSMRCILVDWLIEVAEEYRLHRETLMLTVNFIDRFLSQMSVRREKLQLVGTASMFLAAKYEEIYPPDVGEFVYITDNTYTKKQVLKMEQLILKVLEFDIAAPTANVFCERFLVDMDLTEDNQAYHLAMMLCEMTMIDTDTYLHYLPSKIAAACVCLANHTLGAQAWPDHMVHLTGYNISELSSCIQALICTHSQATSSPQQACRDKYKQSKLKEVSNIVPTQVLPIGC